MKMKMFSQLILLREHKFNEVIKFSSILTGKEIDIRTRICFYFLLTSEVCCGEIFFLMEGFSKTSSNQIDVFVNKSKNKNTSTSTNAWFPTYTTWTEL